MVSIDSKDFCSKTLNSGNALKKSFELFINSLPIKSHVYICAGHFMLVYDKEQKKVVPGIFQEIQNPNLSEALKSSLGIFPTYTWKLGCELVKYAKERGVNAKLLLLINDWQCVPRDEKRLPSEPNSFRKQFYDSFKTLPNTFSKRLEKYELSKDDLVWSDRNEFFMQEQVLRDRFKRRVKRIIKKGIKTNLLLSGSCHFSLQKESNDILFKSSLSDKPKLILSKGKAGCSGEISEMLGELWSNYSRTKDKNGKLVCINFLPLSCRGPVNSGSENAYDIYHYRGTTINAFFNGSNVNSEDGFFKYKDFKLDIYEPENK